MGDRTIVMPDSKDTGEMLDLQTVLENLCDNVFCIKNCGNCALDNMNKFNEWQSQEKVASK